MDGCFRIIGKGWIFIIVIAVIWFIVMQTIPSLDNPEILLDEAWLAKEMLKFINNIPHEYIFYIDFLGRSFPTIVNFYHGAMEFWLLMPFLLFGGGTLESLRIGVVFWGAVILILTCCFGCRFFNNTAGVLSAVLLAANPYFLTSLRTADFYGFGMTIFMLGSLLLFLEWRNTGRYSYFYLGMFFLGFGLNVKARHIWFIIALFAALFFFIDYKNIRKTRLLTGSALALLGMAPVLTAYSTKRFWDWNILPNLFITYSGADNFDILNNLSTRFRQLFFLLNGPGSIYCNIRTLPAFFFLICLTWLLYLVLARKKTTLPRRRIAFILFLFFTIFLQSIYTLTALRPTHLLILFPFIQILIAIAVYETVIQSKNRAVKIALCCLTSVFIIVNIAKCAEDHRALKAEMIKKKSCSVDVLAKWLVENKLYDQVSFDYRTWFAVEFYSELKIKPFSLIYDDNRDVFFDKLEEKMIGASGQTVFVFDLNESKREYKMFNLLAEKLNRDVTVRKRFLWSNGEARFIVCSLM